MHAMVGGFHDHVIMNGEPLHTPSNSCDDNALRNDFSQDISDKASLACRTSISGWALCSKTSDNASAGVHLHREDSHRHEWSFSAL
jgi:hypothetical protein